MMNQFLKRVIGLLLLIIALSGILLCVAAGVLAFRTKSVVLQYSQSFVHKLQKTSQTSMEGLDLAAQALNDAYDSVDNLESTLMTIGSSINNSMHFMDTAATLSGKTFPETITTTRKAIDSASTSAKLIDDTLSIVAAIPFIGSSYSPDVPMSQALNDVSISLSNLPDTFIGIEDDFVEIKSDMVSLKTNIEKTQSQIDKIKTSLTTAKEIVSKYKQMLVELDESIKEIEKLIPKSINTFFIALIIFLGWFALSQLGLIVQGIVLLSFADDAQEKKK